jgi:hypothetical protein
VRNLVDEILTEGAPEYFGIGELHYATEDDMRYGLSDPTRDGSDRLRYRTMGRTCVATLFKRMSAEGLRTVFRRTRRW